MNCFAMLFIYLFLPNDMILIIDLNMFTELT